MSEVVSAKERLDTPGEPAVDGIVLILDDDESLASQTAELLSSQGFRSQYVTSAKEARAIILEGPTVAVVVLDLRMPEVNGLAFVHELRRAAADRLPSIVIVTGMASHDAVVTALRLSVTDYLIKPVRPSELFSSVSRAYELFLDRNAGGGAEEQSPRRDAVRKQSADRSLHALPQKGQTSSLEFLVMINSVRHRYAETNAIDDHQIQMLVDLAWCAEQSKRVSVTGLISGVGISLATGHRRLKELEELGLVSRSCESADRRLNYVNLTEKGAELVESIYQSCMTKLATLSR